MKLRLLLCALFLTAGLSAADLPTVTMEHLYYLQARGERVRKFQPEEMIQYCIAQKIGGPAFDSLYKELFALRMDLMRKTKLEEIATTDPRVVTLTKSIEAYTDMLREEARGVQFGMVREGQVAVDALAAIAKAQQVPPQKP